MQPQIPEQEIKKSILTPVNMATSENTYLSK